MESRLIHPNFLQCLQYIGDPFWSDKFKKMAYGEPIKGCKYKKNKVYIGDSVITPTDYPAKILWVKILDCFHDINIYSPTEIHYSESVEECKNITTWTRIKSKNIKDKLLLKYLKSKEISSSIKGKLEKYLLGSTSVKIKKVYMEDGKISRIDFREVDGETQEKSKPDNPTPIMTSLCVKYIKDETKVYQKYGLVH